MRRLFLFFALLTASTSALAQASAGAHDALQVSGPQAAHILDLWRLTLGICTAVFVAILIAFFYALWRAPRSEVTTPADVSSLTRTERGARRSVVAALAGSALLLFVLIVASVATDRALAAFDTKDAVHIRLTAHQWWWDARYEDPDPSRLFSTANELHIPVGRPVVLTLKSDDVIHSVWLPSLAGKKDLIPGQTTTLNLRADRAGSYYGQCAEFCGVQHTWMALAVIAEPPEAYAAWAERQRQPAAEPSDAQAAAGKDVFLGATCVMCHTITGTDAQARRAPDLTHVGSRQAIASGRLANTRENLAAWIADPQRFKPGVNMPAHALPADQLQALAAYLESLK